MQTLAWAAAIRVELLHLQLLSDGSYAGQLVQKPWESGRGRVVRESQFSLSPRPWLSSPKLNTHTHTHPSRQPLQNHHLGALPAAPLPVKATANLLAPPWLAHARAVPLGAPCLAERTGPRVRLSAPIQWPPVLLGNFGGWETFKEQLITN